MDRRTPGRVHTEPRKMLPSDASSRHLRRGGLGREVGYLRAIHGRYRQGTWKEKRLSLDEFCRVTGYHRKYALRRTTPSVHHWLAIWTSHPCRALLCVTARGPGMNPSSAGTGNRHAAVASSCLAIYRGGGGETVKSPTRA
jgi:hypothetical protein